MVRITLFNSTFNNISVIQNIPLYSGVHRQRLNPTQVPPLRQLMEHDSIKKTIAIINMTL
jgi:hypothetical protein